MNNSGDAAEQVVRLSLEGFEVAAKVTGEAAKNIAVILLSALKQEQKTKGKARLANMIRSGKALKVFSLEQKDLKKFTQEAKRYGVLYNVLRDKSKKGDEHALVDIIARADDASKIQRIFERFELSEVDKADIVTQAEKDIAEKANKKAAKSEKTKADKILEAALSNQKNRENIPNENPSSALTGNEARSEHFLKDTAKVVDKDNINENRKPSVRELLNELGRKNNNLPKAPELGKTNIKHQKER